MEVLIQMREERQIQQNQAAKHQVIQRMISKKFNKRFMDVAAS